MPSSFSSKPGFYDDGDAPAINQSEFDKKGADPGKLTPDAKKKSSQNGPNDGAKRSIFITFKFKKMCIVRIGDLFIFFFLFSGWIGGIFNKLSFKPKNQMILPDDKNPSVSK